LIHKIAAYLPAPLELKLDVALARELAACRKLQMGDKNLSYDPEMELPNILKHSTRSKLKPIFRT